MPKNQWFGWILIIVGVVCLILVTADQPMTPSHEETILSIVISLLALVAGITQASISLTNLRLPRSARQPWLWIMSILLILLVVSISANAFLLLRSNVSPSTTVKAISIITPSSSVISPTSSFPTATPSSVPGPYGGTLVFKDSLRDDGQQHYFQTNSFNQDDIQDACKLTKQGYQITATNSFFNCDELDTFTNFVFQVTANIGVGSSAGFMFRHNGGAKTYIVSIDRSGCYNFNNGPYSLQKPRYTQGNTSYQLTLLAKGDTFTFYTDGHKVDQFKDDSYSSGTIGLMVTGDCQGSTANTQATYTDATVWKL